MHSRQLIQPFFNFLFYVNQQPTRKDWSSACSSVKLSIYQEAILIFLSTNCTISSRANFFLSLFQFVLLVYAFSKADKPSLVNSINIDQGKQVLKYELLWMNNETILSWFSFLWSEELFRSRRVLSVSAKTPSSIIRSYSASFNHRKLFISLCRFHCI